MSPAGKPSDSRCPSVIYDILLGVVLALVVLALTGSIEWRPAPDGGPWRVGCEVRASE